MISEKRRLNTFNIWPGFVDVLATLLIVTIFAIMISIVTQLYFNDLIGKKKSQIVELDSEIVKIGEKSVGTVLSAGTHGRECKENQCGYKGTYPQVCVFHRMGLRNAVLLLWTKVVDRR